MLTTFRSAEKYYSRVNQDDRANGDSFVYVGMLLIDGLDTIFPLSQDSFYSRQRSLLDGHEEISVQSGILRFI